MAKSCARRVAQSIINAILQQHVKQSSMFPAAECPNPVMCSLPYVLSPFLHRFWVRKLPYTEVRSRSSAPVEYGVEPGLGEVLSE
jgi:hypothetical protein